MFDGLDASRAIAKVARVTDVRVAGPDHAVATIEGGAGSYRREPCAKCPWRKDAVGVFPAEAFRHSGVTGACETKSGAARSDGDAYMFACHSNGAAKPAACAGYILRSRDSVSWARGAALGSFDPAKVHDGGVELFDSYYEMAVANGVSPDDPTIAVCKPVANPIRALFVAPTDLLQWADRIRPHITKMAEGSGGRYDSSDLFAALVAGRMLLWIAVEGVEVRCVLIGEIQNFPRLRAMRLIGLVGRHPRQWRNLLSLVEDQAKRQFGCQMMESLHRPRFLSLLRGYLTTHWLSEKRI